MSGLSFPSKLLMGWLLLIPPFLLAGQPVLPLTEPLVHNALAQAIFVAMTYLFVLWAGETEAGYRALERHPMLISLYRFALLAAVWAYLLILFDRIQNLPVDSRFAPTFLSAMPGWAFTLSLGLVPKPRIQKLQGVRSPTKRLHIPWRITLPIVAVLFIALGVVLGFRPPQTESEFRSYWMDILAFLTVSGVLLSFSRRANLG